jgi:hypothetical protein
MLGSGDEPAYPSPVGNHLFADSGLSGPAKQLLADLLDYRVAAFPLCPPMLQKWTVR